MPKSRVYRSYDVRQAQDQRFREDLAEDDLKMYKVPKFSEANRGLILDRIGFILFQAMNSHAPPKDRSINPDYQITMSHGNLTFAARLAAILQEEIDREGSFIMIHSEACRLRAVNAHAIMGRHERDQNAIRRARR